MTRILLDNCIDRRFGRHLEEMDVKHVLDLGWDRMSDVLLLRFAAEQFDLMITVDVNMPYQTNLRGLDLGVIVLRVPSNRLKDCVPKIPELIKAIPLSEKGSFTFV